MLLPWWKESDSLLYRCWVLFGFHFRKRGSRRDDDASGRRFFPRLILAIMWYLGALHYRRCIHFNQGCSGWSCSIDDVDLSVSGWVAVGSRLASPLWFLIGLLVSYVAELLLCLRPVDQEKIQGSSPVVSLKSSEERLYLLDIDDQRLLVYTRLKMKKTRTLYIVSIYCESPQPVSIQCRLELCFAQGSLFWFHLLFSLSLSIPSMSGWRRPSAFTCRLPCISCYLPEEQSSHGIPIGRSIKPHDPDREIKGIRAANMGNKIEERKTHFHHKDVRPPRNAASL